MVEIHAIRHPPSLVPPADSAMSRPMSLVNAWRAGPVWSLEIRMHAADLTGHTDGDDHPT